MATPEKKKVQLRFFKTGVGEYGYGDEFLGVMVPQVRAIVKEVWQNVSLDEVKVLLHSPYHEARLIALLLLVKNYEAKDTSDDIKDKIFEIYTSNTDNINNWDLVDLSAPNIVGNQLFKKDCSLLYEFAQSDHLWKQRIAVVATLYFIRKGEFSHTYSLAKLFMNTKYDLMQKAVGWMLREAGKRDTKRLYDFVQEHKAIMPRTMLRYSIEKFDKETRKELMS